MGKAVKFLPLYLIVATALLIAGKLAYTFITASDLEPAEEVPVNVAVQTITPEEYHEVLELPGRLKAETSVLIASEVTGRVKSWMVTEGATVKEGDVIVTLDTDTLDSKLQELNAQEKRLRASLKLTQSSVKLAEISLNSAQDEVLSAENRLTLAEAENTLARDELKRTTTLFDKKVASQIELDRSRTEFTRFNSQFSTAKASLNQAKNMHQTRKVQLEQAKLNVLQAEGVIAEVEAGINSLEVALTKTMIKAPFSGTFNEHLKEVGDVVQPGDAMGWLYDYSTIRIRVDVSDRYAPFLEPDKPILAAYINSNFPGAVQNLKGTLLIPGLPTLNGGRSEGVELPATIVMMGKAGDALSNTFPVELQADNPGTIFKQGLLARARIKMLTYKSALMIPLSAIRVTESGPRCLVAVTKEGRLVAESRSIEPRSIEDGDVMVRGELKPGDTLIVTGVQELLDGQRITIVDSRQDSDNASSTGD